MEQFHFFYGGPFSQWAPSPFEIQGRTYNTAEQFMMAAKAELFGDDESFKKIMATKRPEEQKALGKLVKGFDREYWQQNAKLIVYRGSYAKFNQNADYFKALAETQGQTLVEASGHDTIWGIGLWDDDPRCLDRKTWLGTNWLGEVLTQLREDMLFEDARLASFV